MYNNIISSNKYLEKSLDAAWLRNEAISQNIANVDTPGYKRKTVMFEELLDSEMKTSKIAKGESKISASDSTISQDFTNLSYRLDGNNVDIERETALMAQNTIKYNTLIQRLNGDFSKLRSVIKGGS